MATYGTRLKIILTLADCLLPTLLWDKAGFPCCRAQIEQRYQKLSFIYYTPNLYQKLKSIIENTDLCIHCLVFIRMKAKIPL